MERCADRQLDGPTYAAGLGRFNGEINRRSSTAYNDLSGRIVIRKLDYASRAGFGDNFIDNGLFGTEDRRHGALSSRDRALHAIAPKAKQACCVRDRQRAGRGQRGIFAKRMSGNKGSQIGDVAAGGLSKNGKCRHRGGKKSGLCIAGKTKILFRPVFHHREEILAKRRVHLVEDGSRLGMGISKRGAHANGL